MFKTQKNILVAVLVGNFLASFALAVDGSAPWNPYSDTNRGPNPQSAPVGRAQNSPHMQGYVRNRGQYPNGLYGTRVVNTVVASRRLDPARCRVRVDLNRRIATATAECRYLDAKILQYSRSLWSISRYRNASREHYNAYLNVLNHLNALKVRRNQSASNLMSLRGALARVDHKLRSNTNTRIIISMRNHLKRSYVPSRYLRDKAVAYVLEHPELIGTTVHLNF
jgi:hypothetical protein